MGECVFGEEIKKDCKAAERATSDALVEFCKLCPALEEYKGKRKPAGRLVRA